MAQLEDLEKTANDITPSNSNQHPKYYGLYRGKVVDNKDPKKLGRVKCWIPELSFENKKETDGVWCRVMSNCYGSNPDGKNLTDDMGSISIPPVDSFVFIMFERGATDHGYIIGGPNFDKGQPTEAEYGDQYYNKSILEKRPTGRIIMLSDDKADAGVIIRSKDRNKGKRSVKNPLRDDSMQIVIQESDSGKYIKLNDGSKHVIIINEDDGSITLSNNKGDSVVIKDTNNIQITTASGSKIKMDNNISLVAASGGSIVIDSGVTIKGSVINLN